MGSEQQWGGPKTSHRPLAFFIKNIKPYGTGPLPVCIIDKAKDMGWGIPIYAEFALKK